MKVLRRQAVLLEAILSRPFGRKPMLQCFHVPVCGLLHVVRAAFGRVAECGRVKRARKAEEGRRRLMYAMWPNKMHVVVVLF